MRKANSPSHGRIDDAYDHGISLWTVLIISFYVVFGRLSARRLKDKENGHSPTLSDE